MDIIIKEYKLIKLINQIIKLQNVGRSCIN